MSHFNRVRCICILFPTALLKIFIVPIIPITIFSNMPIMIMGMHEAMEVEEVVVTSADTVAEEGTMEEVMAEETINMEITNIIDNIQVVMINPIFRVVNVVLVKIIAILNLI